MNKEIEKLRKEFNEKLDKLEKELKNEENNKNWKPEYYKAYWYINSFGNIYYDIWKCHPLDEQRYNIGNVFRTKEEAEIELERRKIETILKRNSCKFRASGKNWILEYSYHNKEVSAKYVNDINDGTCYFESKRKAQEMINTIGEEKLKKYWLRVEE